LEDVDAAHDGQDDVDRTPGAVEEQQNQVAKEVTEKALDSAV